MTLTLLPRASLVNRITWAAIVAVLVSAAILGGIATWLAVGGMESQAQDTLRIIGSTASQRVGDWIAANERQVASMVPAGLTSPASLPAPTPAPAAAAATADAASAADAATPASGVTVGAIAAPAVAVAPVASAPAAPPENPDARLLEALQQSLTAGAYRVTFMAFDGDHRYVRAPVEPMPPGYNPVERPWYKEAVASGKPTVPAPYRDVALNQLNVTFEQVVKRGDQVLGVIGGLKSLDEVTGIIAAIKPTPHSYAFIIDGSGKVVIHPNADFVLKPSAQVMPWFSADSANDAVVAINDNGRNAWLRIVKIPNIDWRLAIVLDKADTLSGLTTLVASIAVAALVVVVITAVLLMSLLRRSFAPLRKVRDAMVSVSDGRGDLTTRIEISGHDEVGQIGSAFNAFNETLRRIVAEVQSASAEVKLAAQEIATGNQDLSQRTEQQAGTIQKSSSAMHQITAVSNSNAGDAHEANRIAQETASLAEAGGSKVVDVVATMQEITASSKRIGEIIGVIDGIAFQTNILALNAAVEAARAGEQGRGFAVVAGEVRSLAQRSSEAARDIRALIQRSTSGVEQGAQRVDDAGQTISQVVQSVKAVSVLMARIVEASEQQRGGIGGVNDAVSQIDLMTQQNAALVEQASAAAQSLRDQSERLVDAVGRFKT